MIQRIKKIPTFLKEVKEELKKVNWSTRQELIGATKIVVIACLFLTTYIAFVDFGLLYLVNFLLK